MRYRALAVDYDGTLAGDEVVPPEALEAIARLRMSGRRTILVTGRLLDDLIRVFPRVALFDRVVAENGAILYEPATGRQDWLADAPPNTFLQRLQERGVSPLEVGHVIVATRLPHRETVLDAIQALGLELQVIFNRSAVMVLPAGTSKASGLEHALRSLGLSRHEVVAVGDAENDHSFLNYAECPVAVANAIPSIIDEAALVTGSRMGAGVAEVVEGLLQDDLARLDANPKVQPKLVLGLRHGGSAVELSAYASNVLIAGPSGSGKSTVAAGLVERLTQDSFQVCIVDPEGDYGTLPEVVTIGGPRHAVEVNEVLAALADPAVSLNVNLLGIPLADRPAFFAQLLPTLEAMRMRTARPHWLVLDEAHHMWPTESAYMHPAPRALSNTVIVTVHPDRLPRSALSAIDAVIAVGEAPELTLKSFAKRTGARLPATPDVDSGDRKAVIWCPRGPEAPVPIRIVTARADRLRHLRKYAEGNMHYHSFYFRGPTGHQNLKAQNLAVFSQIAEGIDDETWIYHLRRGDYSRWIRECVKDSRLADQTSGVEQRDDVDSTESRRLVRAFIEQRYTLPE